MFRNSLVLLAAFSVFGAAAAAGESADAPAVAVSAVVPAALVKTDVQPVSRQDPKEAEQNRRYFRYTRDGMRIGEVGEGRFSAEVNVRSQMRFSSPFEGAPRNESHFGQKGGGDYRFRRARFKTEGHAFTSWITYKYEHDLVDPRVLDAQITIEKWDWLQFRFGQWKADYSRERIDSSGKQQFADRSIVNRAFTLDRQKGATVLGHLMEGTPGDSRYYLGVFAGNGRGFQTAPGELKLDHDDGQPMLMARYQWNFLGRDVDHSQSDLEYHDEPAAAVAFAVARNRSRYTRFSSSGGGQLDGFEFGQPGQYSLRQVMEEAALKYRGLSLQHELHWKTIEDNVNIGTTNMRGTYVQAGYFFHHLIPRVPKQLELGARYAMVDPNRVQQDDLQKELAFVANWYFYGHSNKVTFDTSRYSLGRAGAEDLNDTQVRLQWDVSF